MKLYLLGKKNHSTISQFPICFIIIIMDCVFTRISKSVQICIYCKNSPNLWWLYNCGLARLQIWYYSILILLHFYPLVMLGPIFRPIHIGQTSFGSWHYFPLCLNNPTAVIILRLLPSVKCYIFPCCSF